MFESRSSERSLRLRVSGRRFVVITEEGARFAKECFCSSVSVAGSEIELYGFLLKLLSFGGVLPLDVVRRWQRLGVVRRASGRRFCVVSRDVGVLPKAVVEEVMGVIWGECPKSIYV